MTNSVAADGQTSMTGPLKSANGTVAAPSISFASDPDSGFYRKAANSIAISLEGVDRVVFTTATATFSCAVSVPAKSFAISKIADGTANRLYGTDGSGVATEVTLGTGLSLSSSSLSATSALPRGHIDGLILSNGTDATNDIDIAAGKCRDSTDAVDIVIATALGKQLDANWAAGGTTGTPAGGRNSAAGITDATYHVWAVRTAASSAGDVYYHTSATAATVLTALQAETGGADYIYARHIGSIIRTSAAIKLFTQIGNHVMWAVPVGDVNDTSAGTLTTSAISRTLFVPTGIKVKADLGVYYAALGEAVGVYYALVSSLDTTDTVPALAAHTVVNAVTGATTHSGVRTQEWTNTSSQVRSRVSAASGATTRFAINTFGFYHPRGVDA
jgi:hypothetical protein